MKDQRNINTRKRNNNKAAHEVAKSSAASRMIYPSFVMFLCGRCFSYFISFNSPQILCAENYHAHFIVEEYTAKRAYVIGQGTQVVSDRDGFNCKVFGLKS